MTARLSTLLAVVLMCGGCSGSAIDTLNAPATTGTAKGTDTFSSFLALGGSSVHTFSLGQAGTLTVTLTSVTPGGVLGLGVGTPDASGAGCTLTSAVDATAAVVDAANGTATPQLTIQVASGKYCVKVYDNGQLDGIGRSFTVSIGHP
jgi:hypothetical protein